MEFCQLPKDKPTIAEWKDNVLVAASNKYQKASKVQRWVLGENYRREWSQPVGMKMFDVTKEKGGFKILSLGGGKQTRSLKLEDKNGKEWSLRTIDKDPEKAIPENFRNSVAKDIVQDLISAANPYAPLTVPILAKAVGVTQASPELFFVLMMILRLVIIGPCSRIPFACSKEKIPRRMEKIPRARIRYCRK
jgi:hypothetical protein